MREEFPKLKQDLRYQKTTLSYHLLKSGRLTEKDKAELQHQTTKNAREQGKNVAQEKED